MALFFHYANCFFSSPIATFWYLLLSFSCMNIPIGRYYSRRFFLKFLHVFVVSTILASLVHVRAIVSAEGPSATIAFVLDDPLSEYTTFQVAMDIGRESEWIFSANPVQVPPTQTVNVGEHVISVMNTDTTKPNASYTIYLTQNGQVISPESSGASGVARYLNDGDAVILHIRRPVYGGGIPGVPPLSIPPMQAGGECSFSCVSEGSCVQPYIVKVEGADPENVDVTYTITSHDGGDLDGGPLNPGNYRVTVTPERLHYPQTFYVRVSDQTNSVISNRVVMGSILVHLEPGQKLTVHVEPTIESYNLIFSEFRSVSTALIFNRPYFHMAVTDDLGIAPNEWPNNLVAIYALGKEALATDLAATVANALVQPSNTTVEFRTNQLTILFARDADGNVPFERLFCMSKESLAQLSDQERTDLRNALQAELKTAIIGWIDAIMSKYYRLSDAAGINAQAVNDLGAMFSFVKETGTAHINKIDAMCMFGMEYCYLWTEKVITNELQNPVPVPVPLSSSSSSQP